MSRECRRLYAAVEVRAAEIGRASDALLAAAGGPSSTTMTKLRNGSYRPRSDSMARLDLALEWEPGSAKQVWEGGSPVPVLRRSLDAAPDPEIAEFVIPGRNDVHVVVKAPLKQRDALEAAITRLLGGIPV